ncbi:hypothetical protein, partial [Paraburkholderia sp.]|uniref:hypothetical protein n=1 Tax=Paraburkholderia sp. TaxID=1926495 RepID=UPI002AFF7EC4
AALRRRSARRHGCWSCAHDIIFVRDKNGVITNRNQAAGTEEEAIGKAHRRTSEFGVSAASNPQFKRGGRADHTSRTARQTPQYLPVESLANIEITWRHSQSPPLTN